jgi:ATP-dependent Clp protease protease subunit
MSLLSKEQMEDMMHTSLVEHETLTLWDPIDTDSAHALRVGLTDLALRKSTRATILIDSPGGEMYAGWKLYDFIRLLGIPVRGIVTGLCSSGALTVLQACSPRLASPHARFLAHNAKLTVKDVSLVDDWKGTIRKAMRDTERGNEWCIRMLTERTKLNETAVRELLDRGSRDGYRMDVPEAIRKGFLDKEIDSDDQIFRFRGTGA